MKTNYLLIFVIVFIFSLNLRAQNKIWNKTTSKKDNSELYYRKSIPSKFELFSLNVNEFINNLKKAPNKTVANKNSNTIVSIPIEDGEFEQFMIFETPIFEAKLAEQFPDIKTFTGFSMDNSSDIIKISVNKYQFYGMVLRANKPTIYIDPYSKDSSEYIVYSKKNLPVIDNGLICLVDDQSKKNESNILNSKTTNVNDGNLRTYRLALACTGEYSQYHINEQGVSASATDAVKKEAVLSAMVTTMSRVNGIFERDLSLTMVFVANNSDIIFLNSITDGFSNNNAYSLINESQSVIDANIGLSNYDIGHTFSTGGGGLAQLNSPCTTSKAKGITGSSNPIGDAYDVDYVAHEMGHQYGANHTFNGDSSSCGGGNRNSSTAVEPGSGSTIMAYAGICSPENVQTNSDSYFHIISIEEMWSNISSGASSSCATITDTANDFVPVITPGSDYTIPISTPFVLTGVASDGDGDSLTYCWEQIDVNLISEDLQSTNTEGPLFRSMFPNTSSLRYFPEFSTVLAGNISSDWEVLPSVSRTMSFDLTVRDNNSSGGQIAQDNVVITTDDNYGPFEVTSQNTTGISWEVGDTETISWDVNGTQNITGAANVNILLSVDNGVTFSVVLASNTTNDGSEDIVVPNQVSSNCRILIQPTNNIFYQVNSSVFEIVDSSLSINEIEFGTFNIYPNPSSSGKVNINLVSKNNSEDIEISLYDVMGRVVSNQTLKSNSLNFSEELNFENVSAGTYLLNVSRGSQSASKHLIIY